MKIQQRRVAGYTLVEILIVASIIGLLAMVGIPNFVRARETGQLNSVINNLRVIEGAKEQFAIEMRQTTGAECDMERIKPFIRGDGEIKQVVGETYQTNPIGMDATVDMDGKKLLDFDGSVPYTIWDLAENSI
jgi:prepilin-type N-terminal cleavage/methylation domain-containing protein